MPIPFRSAALARASLTVAAVSFAASAAHAASFDCQAARTPVEHAICGDAQLSVLDSELDDTYRTALKAQGNDGGELKAAQRAWLKSRTSDGKVDVAALKEAYRTRIGELKAMPVFPAWNAPVGGPTFRLTKIAKQHDFVLRMLKACPAGKGDDDATCEGPAQLLISEKGRSAPMQTLNFANVFVTLPKGANGPLANSAKLYDYQGVVNVDDFNFDGNEDFGIQTGNEGSYGGPSYDVYLFDAKTHRFVYNDGMTQTILETLGFFDVDAAHKRIRTLAKSGCCYHETTTYRVDNNDQLVAVARHIEDGQGGGDKMEITDETLVNGKWRSKKHYVPMPD